MKYECTENERKFLDRIKKIGQLRTYGNPDWKTTLTANESRIYGEDFPETDFQQLLEPTP